MNSDRCYAEERGEDCYGADENCYPMEAEDFAAEENHWFTVLRPAILSRMAGEEE